MKVLTITAKKTAPVSTAVGMWNYLDAEHATVVHKGYVSFDVLFQDPQLVIILQVIRLPVFSFIKNASWMAFRILSNSEFENYSVQHGVPVLTHIKVEEPQPNFTEYHMTYKFYLSNWRIIFYPLLKWLVPKWIEQIWKEDLPLKLRRQKVLQMNFKDFSGLPEEIDARKTDTPLHQQIPVPRCKDSPVDVFFKNYLD